MKRFERTATNNNASLWKGKGQGTDCVMLRSRTFFFTMVGGRRDNLPLWHDDNSWSVCWTLSKLHVHHQQHLIFFISFLFFYQHSDHGNSLSCFLMILAFFVFVEESNCFTAEIRSLTGPGDYQSLSSVMGPVIWLFSTIYSAFSWHFLHFFIS